MKSGWQQFAIALAECRARRAILLIAKLDGRARDAHFLLGLEGATVEYVAADMPDAKRGDSVMALVAQEEARMAIARTRAVVVAAKAHGLRRR